MIANLTEHVRLNAHRDNRNNAPSIKINALTALLATFTGGLSLQCYERTFFGMNEDEIKKAKNRERAKKWALANQERVKENAKRRYLADPDKAKERQKQWRIDNPEKYLAGKKKYHAIRGGRSKNKETCAYCKKDCYISYISATPYCNLTCYHNHMKERRLYWVKCATCHASLGMPVVVSGRLLNKIKNTISHTLTKMGVVRYKWPLIPKPKKPAWFYQWQIDKIYMSGYNPKFPEWAAWNFGWQYHKLTKEQRRERWQKRDARIKACPIATQKKREAGRLWKKENPGRTKEIRKKWMKSEKGIQLQRRVRKMPLNKIKHNLRKRLRDFLKSARLEKMSVSGLIGCSSLEFKHYIEKQFKKGMTWQNYGTHWHVDHILPCASFDHTNKAHVAQCWHFTNLRPLEAVANIEKSDKITEPQMMLMI